MVLSSYLHTLELCLGSGEFRKCARRATGWRIVSMQAGSQEERSKTVHVTAHIGPSLCPFWADDTKPAQLHLECEAKTLVTTRGPRRP